MASAPKTGTPLPVPAVGCAKATAGAKPAQISPAQGHSSHCCAEGV